MEYFEEKQPGGVIVRHPATRWRARIAQRFEIQLAPPRKSNPSYQGRIWPAHRCSQPTHNRQGDPIWKRDDFGNCATCGWQPEWLPPVIKEFVVKAGEEVVIPSEHDWAIQRVACSKCVRKPLYCRDTSHRGFWTTIGGLAPGLERVGESGEVEPVTLHPTLADAPMPRHEIETLHDRVMRRVGAA